MNYLGLKKKKKKKKKNESVLCTFLSLFGLTTLLFSLTTVHGVVTRLVLSPCTYIGHIVCDNSGTS